MSIALTGNGTRGIPCSVTRKEQGLHWGSEILNKKAIFQQTTPILSYTNLMSKVKQYHAEMAKVPLQHEQQQKVPLVKTLSMT